ncbi:hypothetical protein CsSME_00018059 [Camellia sinensis var. sinensis]
MSTAVDARGTATRHLGVVVGLPSTREEPANMLSNARVAAEHLFGAVNNAEVRDVSRFGDADLMRAFCLIQMESLTLATALIGKSVGVPLKAQL